MNKPDDKTLEQLNRSIAMRCGWEGVERYQDGSLIGCRKGCWRGEVPDYCRDLNAMHEAENISLRDEDSAARYWSELDQMNPDPGPYRAEAWQRAVALDRTLSKEPIV